MRITTQTINNTILTNLNNITTGMAKLNAQISSGNQMATISDNPVNMVTALILRTNLTQITNYQNNLSFGNTAINAAENSLTQMKDLVMQAKTLAIQQVNASVSPENRASAAQQVNNLWQEAITLANSQVAGQYVFGGYRTTGYTAAEPAPFIADMGSGYQVNGNSIAGTSQMLTGTVDNTPPANLIAGDVRINGTDIGPVTLNVAASNGLNMAGANNLATAINTAVSPAVTAKLTTLYGGAASTAEGGFGGTTLTQSINGVSFNVAVPNGATANNVAVLPPPPSMQSPTRQGSRPGSATAATAGQPIPSFSTTPSQAMKQTSWWAHLPAATVRHPLPTRVLPPAHTALAQETTPARFPFPPPEHSPSRPARLTTPFSTASASAAAKALPIRQAMVSCVMRRKALPWQPAI